MSSLDIISFILGMISAIFVQTILFFIKQKLEWNLKVKKGRVAIGAELELFCDQLIVCLTNGTVTPSATQIWGILLTKDELILSIPQYAKEWKHMNTIFPALITKDINESDKENLMENLDLIKQNLKNYR